MRSEEETEIRVEVGEGGREGNDVGTYVMRGKMAKCFVYFSQ